MRRLPLAFAFIAAAPVLQAETALVDLMDPAGLRATETALAVLPDPTVDQVAALGSVRFLGGIERVLQLRYKVGISGELGMFMDFPLLRLPIPENPAAQPLTGTAISDMLTGIVTDMEAAAAGLASIADDDTVLLRVELTDLWFDINANSTRDPGEGVGQAIDVALGGIGEAEVKSTIAFDTADVAWLQAYAHLLAGLGHGFLAIDAGTAVDRVLAETAAFRALNPEGVFMFFSGMDDTVFADTAAMLIHMIEGPIDATHSRAAAANLTAMIDANTMFWSRVARETDNDAEWIPNKGQVSALGIDFPDDIGVRWQRVLGDAADVLSGDQLIPFWRLADGQGVNLGLLLQDPPDVDLVGLFQGGTLLPYIETGRVVDGASLFAFEQLVGGQSGLYALILN